MRATTALRKEFLRRVYREAPASEAARNTFLDGLADTALSQVEAGVRRVGASGGGFSSSFAILNGWDPRDVLELIAWARGYLAESTVAAAVALVIGPIRAYGTDFSCVRI